MFEVNPVNLNSIPKDVAKIVGRYVGNFFPLENYSQLVEFLKNFESVLGKKAAIEAEYLSGASPECKRPKTNP